MSLSLSSWRRGTLRAVRGVLAVDAAVIGAVGAAYVGWGAWSFYDGLRGGADRDHGLIEMLFVLVGPLMAAAGIALLGVGVLLGRSVRAFDQERPGAALALLTLFGGLLVAFALSDSEGFRLPPSPHPLAAGVVHLACVGLALAAGAPVRWRVWRAGRDR